MEEAELVARGEQLVRLAAAMDVDALVGAYAHDVVLELPFRPGRAPRRIEGREAAAEFVAFARDSFSEYAMRSQAIYAVPASNTVIIEATGRGITVSTGRVYDQRYVLVISFDDAGRIKTWREYFDPDAVRAAFSSG